MNKDRDRNVNMHDKVRIKATSEKAHVVYFDEQITAPKRYLLEIDGSNEMPTEYDRDEFEVI